MADPEHVALGRVDPLGADRAHLARSVFEYVRRTGQDLVIGQRGDRRAFAGDPLRRTSPAAKSILCVPVATGAAAAACSISRTT